MFVFFVFVFYKCVHRWRQTPSLGADETLLFTPPVSVRKKKEPVTQLHKFITNSPSLRAPMVTRKQIFKLCLRGAYIQHKFVPSSWLLTKGIVVNL